jgi:hypothetical protein
MRAFKALARSPSAIAGAEKSIAAGAAAGYCPGSSDDILSNGAPAAEALRTSGSTSQRSRHAPFVGMSNAWRTRPSEIDTGDPPLHLDHIEMPADEQNTEPLTVLDVDG